jgi:hypothetical protein
MPKVAVTKVSAAVMVAVAEMTTAVVAVAAAAETVAEKR